MRTFNKMMLMLGTALLLQACTTTDNQIAVTQNVADTTFSQTAEEMTGGSVKVYGFDDPIPPSPFTDAGPGYGLTPPENVVATDPNVMVYSLDGGPAVHDGGIPPMMPPAAEVPYRSPFPGTDGNAPLTLRPPGTMGDAGAGFTRMSPDYGSAVTVSGMGLQDAGGNNARIYFGHGSSQLNSAGKQVVQSIAQRQMQYNPAGLIAVEGHASSRAEVSDPVERRILNLKMSMDRAFRVSSDLIRSGVPATAIKTTVYGDTRPAGPMDSKDGEAASRRVDILTGP